MDSTIRFKIMSENNIDELISLNNIIVRRIRILQNMSRVTKVSTINNEEPKCVTNQDK